MIARPDAACFVGIDLHKDTLTACVLRRRDREVSYVKIACKCRDQIRSFFASLPQPSAVAIETVGFYRWLWTELEPLAWAPPENVQVLRNWTRHHNGLTRQHQRRLVEIEQDRPQSERRIRELMRASEFACIREILKSIPGVGLVTAATVIGEIGDFSRFPDSKAIGRYAGLAPTVYASGNSSRLGRISKTGAPDLRWVLQQAAWTAIRCDAGLKKTWLRIAKTAGKKAAAVAIARKILVLISALVRKDEPYKSREPIAA